VAYRLNGTYLETCPCDVLCPCSASNLVLPADVERCILILGFHVASGEVDGVDVSGTTAAMVVDSPQQMSDGNWRVGLLIDENASGEQREKLVSVFSGEQGGPAAAFGPLVGEVLGVEYAPISWSDDGRTHAMRVGDALDVEIEDFASADGESPMILEGAAHPVGTRITIAQAKRGRVSAFGIEVDTEGKNGHAAPFAWAA